LVGGRPGPTGLQETHGEKLIWTFRVICAVIHIGGPALKTLPLSHRYILLKFIRAHSYVLCLLAALPFLVTVQAAAQMVVGSGPGSGPGLGVGVAASHDIGSFADGFLQNGGFAIDESDATPTQCQGRIVENKVVASNRERREVSYHVQPPGIIPDPKVWPYFAWSDTSLGVVRTRDGSGYLFFGSDGG